jgi:phenylalanyl-tRNA synthetase beta chain
MPVIGIPLARLRSLLRAEVSPSELLEHFGHLGCDVEGFTQLARVRCNRCGFVAEMTATEEIPPTCEACAGDLRADHTPMEPLEVVRMELLAVRPDMFDPGGLARVLRGYLSVETGAPRYELGPPALRLTVDEVVRAPDSYRPEIACAVVENVQLDLDALKVIMKLQENLHWAVGRDRKHASIGVYDLDAIAPDLTYTAQDPDRFSFTPLGAPSAGPEHALTLRRILAEHPKGMAYAHLLRDLRRYPILRDSRGTVLSMPPIINSEATKVTVASRRLFIDVTGLARRVVERTLNIIVTSLLENLPEARVHAVEIVGPEPGATRRTPDFSLQELRIAPSHAARTLGVAVSTADAVTLLRRMRHDAEAIGPDEVRVGVPPYRNDILHEIDLIEDLAIAYGYHRITPSLVPTFTVGAERPEEIVSNQVREMLCGLGYSEVMTLVLTNPRVHDEALGRPASDDVVRVSHPVSSEQTMVRTSLLAGLLATLEHNITHPLPQRIFEVGDVTLLDAAAETLATDRRRLACGVVAARVGFEDIKALAEAILREFGCAGELRCAAEPPFLGGRAAEVWLIPATGGEPRRAMWFGEVHPEVLERFHLQNPAVLLEADLEALQSGERVWKPIGEQAAR